MVPETRYDQPFDIFLSYANEDLPRVRPLVQALESEGWSVWWDRHIPAGRTFRQVIAEALKNAHCVVVVWTATSVERNWVLEEAQDGVDRDCLIPVFLDDIQAPFGLRLIQGARLDTWEGDAASPAFQRLHTDLIGHLDSPSSAPVTPEPIAADDPPAADMTSSVPRATITEPPPSVTNALGMEFVLIPAGEFQMGSMDGFDNEHPVHPVRMSQPFYIGRIPVTQSQWEAVMGNNPSHFGGKPARG